MNKANFYKYTMHSILSNPKTGHILNSILPGDNLLM